MNEIEKMEKEVRKLKTKLFITSMGCILAVLFFIFNLIGCTHLGIADRATMMQRWQRQIANNGITEHILWEVNEYGNWYAQGEKQYPVIYASEDTDKPWWAPKDGKCVDQSELKLDILKELGISAKRGHCTITRDPYRPIGHRFVVAQLKDKRMILDNGAVQGCVWEYEAVKRSTWGVKDWRVE